MSLLGVDLGTTTCKAAAFSTDGRCLAAAQREYDILHPAPFAAELDGQEVWGKTQEVIAEVTSATSRDPVGAICIGSMGEALAPLSHDRRVLGNSILCFDSRGDEYARDLAHDFTDEEFYRIDANLIGPQFGLPKLLWIRDHQPGLFNAADHFLPWSDAVAFLLGGDPCVTNSHASRLLLLDVERNDWSPRILNWAGISPTRLGRVVDGGTAVGTVAGSLAARLGLPPGVKIVSGGHDQCCTALGCGCIDPGQAVCGLGTFQCITPVFAWPADPLQLLQRALNIENHALAGRYVTFLYNQAGSLVKWFRDTFAADQHEDAGANVYAWLNAELPADPSGLLVLPHFEPPVWPRHIPGASGAILGLRTTTRRGEILKAIMECSAMYFLSSVTGLADVGMPIHSLTAVGGGASSDAWVQINADVFGVPVIRPHATEAGVAGAAILAGLATGQYAAASEAVEAFVQADRQFEPDPSRHAFYVRQATRLEQVYPALASLLLLQ